MVCYDFFTQCCELKGRGLVRTHPHLFRFPIFASNCGGDYMACDGIIPFNNSS